VREVSSHDARAFEFDDYTVVGGVGATGSHGHLRAKVEFQADAPADVSQRGNCIDPKVFLGSGALSRSCYLVIKTGCFISKPR
jgi:hypothetical protein